MLVDVVLLNSEDMSHTNVRVVLEVVGVLPQSQVRNDLFIVPPLVVALLTEWSNEDMCATVGFVLPAWVYDTHRLISIRGDAPNSQDESG